MFKFKKKEKVNNNNIDNKNINNNNKKKIKEVSRRRKKMGLMEICDDIWANKVLGDVIIDNGEELSDERIKLAYGKVLTKDNVIQCYTVDSFPREMKKGLLSNIRRDALQGSVGVKIHFFTSTQRHKINWEDRGLQQSLKTYEKYVNTNGLEEKANNVFSQRENMAEYNDQIRKVKSIKYYTEAEMVHKRTLHKISIYIIIVGERKNPIMMEKVIKRFKSSCSINDLKVNKIKADIFEWNRAKYPTSLREEKDVTDKTSTKIMSDDLVALTMGYGQGRIGERGLPLGEDVYSGLMVFKKLKEDKDDAENILITGRTGSGKSIFMKNVLTWAIPEINEIILDYEGIEYINMAKWINDGNEGDAVIIDMGGNNNKYFEPLRIGDITHEEEIDKDLKRQAQDYTMALFRVIAGDEGKLDILQERILSECIQNIYLQHNITDSDPETWKFSKELRINMIYDELCLNIDRQNWIEGEDDSMQRKAKELRERLRRYFVEGEIDYGMFGEPLDIEEIRKARFIVFAFGEKGKSNEGASTIKLAVKQLCVSNLSQQITLYNRYINDKYTIIVWEEYQRWCQIKGSEEIIGNAITGGRKYGQINFICSNDLANFIDEENKANSKIRQNITGYCVGLVKEANVRHEFCEKLGLQLLEPDLVEIANGNTKKGIKGKFNKAFCVYFEGTEKYPLEIKAIVKAVVHPALIEGGIYGKVSKEEEVEEEED